MTVTRTQNGSIERINAAWTSAADGSQTQVVNIWGTILRVVTDPGSPAPTDNYDLTAPDEFGFDVLGGAGRGTDRDTTTTEHFCPGVAFTDGTTTSVMPVVVCGDVTLTLANAGDSKVGTITIFVKR